MRYSSLFLAAALAFATASAASAAEGTNAADAAIAAKAIELAPTNAPTPTRLISLHRFVRDEIRQVPAQYG
jgi:hypothetical protein